MAHMNLKSIVLTVPLIFTAALFISPDAYAQRGDHDRRGSHYGERHHGRHHHERHHRHHRHYHKPRFHHHDSVVISTPNFYFSVSESHGHRPVHHHHHGTIVTSIPFGYTRMIINGGTYYHCQGVYYQPVYGGYMIVPPPGIFY